jgi:hypothetical protein
MACGLATDLYTSVITTMLKQMISIFQIAGHGMDNLTTGCHPILVSHAAIRGKGTVAEGSGSVDNAVDEMADDNLPHCLRIK